MNAEIDPELQRLAASMDCLTEPEYLKLGNYKQSTATAQRKRGEGPEYVILGNTVLYPRASLAKYLAAKVRTRGAESGGRSLL